MSEEQDCEPRLSRTHGRPGPDGHCRARPRAACGAGAGCSEPRPIDQIPPQTILPQPLGLLHPQFTLVCCFIPALGQVLLGLTWRSTRSCRVWHSLAGAAAENRWVLQGIHIVLFSAATSLFAGGSGRTTGVTEWPEGHMWGDTNPTGSEVPVPGQRGQWFCRFP